MEIPYFIRLLTKNQLVLSTIRASSVADIDLDGTVFTHSGHNSLEINGFELTCEEHFKSVSILITRYGTLIDLISQDPKYFDESAYYFNVYNSGRLKRTSQHNSGQSHRTKSKRIGQFNLFGGCLQATVFRSEQYGSKIMLSYRKANSLIG